MPTTHTTTMAAGTVNTDAYYRVIGELIAQKKQADGTFGPEIILDRKTGLFKIGDPSDTAPKCSICTGADTPVNGCSAPTPTNGSTVAAGNIAVLHKVHIAVVGSTSSAYKYQFEAKWELAGPKTASFRTTEGLMEELQRGG